MVTLMHLLCVNLRNNKLFILLLVNAKVSRTTSEGGRLMIKDPLLHLGCGMVKHCLMKRVMLEIRILRLLPAVHRHPA